MFKHNSEFQSVISDDLSCIVGPTVDEPRPRAWIRSVVDSRQSVHGERGYFAGKPLRSRIDKWVVDAVGRSVAAWTAGRIGVDRSQTVGVGRQCKFVDQRRRESAGQT